MKQPLLQTKQRRAEEQQESFRTPLNLAHQILALQVLDFHSLRKDM